jgi:hypothetical protein
MLLYRENGEMKQLNLEDHKNYYYKGHLIFDKDQNLVVNIVALDEFLLLTRHSVNN